MNDSQNARCTLSKDNVFWAIASFVKIKPHMPMASLWLRCTLNTSVKRIMASCSVATPTLLSKKFNSTPSVYSLFFLSTINVFQSVSFPLLFLFLFSLSSLSLSLCVCVWFHKNTVNIKPDCSQNARLPCAKIEYSNQVLNSENAPSVIT